MRPVIGVISDVKASGGHVVHGVTEKYIYAVARGAQAMPVLIPGTISAVDADMAPERVVIEEIFDLVDGIFLPGSPSNVGPQHYGDAAYDPPLPADPHRDDISLPLIRAALERGVPLFGVCRGFQEMNVGAGRHALPEALRAGRPLRPPRGSRRRTSTPSTGRRTTWRWSRAGCWPASPAPRPGG